LHGDGAKACNSTSVGADGTMLGGGLVQWLAISDDYVDYALELWHGGLNVVVRMRSA
jgi:hypothetical protein